MLEQHEKKLEISFSDHDYAIAHAWTAVHGIAHINKFGEFLDCNQAYCEILGRSKGDIIGKTFMEFTNPIDLLLEDRSAKDVVNGYINQYTMNKSYILPNGKKVQVRLEVRRYPWDVREEFAHFVVHCYYMPKAEITFKELITNKAIGIFVASVSAIFGAITGNIDLVVNLVKAIIEGNL